MSAVMPETRYARARDGVHVAYQVLGSGPFDLIFANSWCSLIEFSWSRPACPVVGVCLRPFPDGGEAAYAAAHHT